MDITVPATALPLKEAITGLYKTATGPVKQRFKNYITDKKIKKIYEHLRDLGKVRTIWQTDRPVPIKNFYYPQKVKHNELIIPINNIGDLTKISKRIIIQGIVGQGKSIFLRHLCASELKQIKLIPVFIELRKYKKGSTLLEQICENLEQIGLDRKVETFEFLVEKQKIRLILDAYDELPDNTELEVITEIEAICRKYPNLEIIISSRPDYSIQNSEFFSICSIEPLKKIDLLPLLNKLCETQYSANKIYDGIRRGGDSIINLLTTPLMVTLLVFVYRADQKIPTKPIDFYDSLFTTVLSRHDKLKPGEINRSRKTIISDSTFQKMFNCLSFLSSQDSKLSMKEEEIISYIEKSKSYLREDLNIEGYLSDTCRVTCLILKDGFYYNYLHKSIQEYHAAKFISALPENKAVEFYKKIQDSKKSHKWHGQIDFLLELDKYRCNKFFLLKCIDNFDKEFFHKNGTLSELLTKTAVMLNPRKTRIASIRFFPLKIKQDLEEIYIGKDILKSIAQFIFKISIEFLDPKEIKKMQYHAPPHPIRLGELLDALRIKDDAIKTLGAKIREELGKKKELSEEIISKMENVQDIFDL
jgi:hypothetical protein